MKVYDLNVEQFLPGRGDEVEDTGERSFLTQARDQQGEQDHVRECCCKVYHLQSHNHLFVISITCYELFHGFSVLYIICTRYSNTSTVGPTSIYNSFTLLLKSTKISFERLKRNTPFGFQWF